MMFQVSWFSFWLNELPSFYNATNDMDHCVMIIANIVLPNESN